MMPYETNHVQMAEMPDMWERHVAVAEVMGMSYRDTYYVLRHDGLAHYQAILPLNCIYKRIRQRRLQHEQR
jgi:hypothetical protein